MRASVLHGFGLTIATDLPIPGTVPAAHADAAPDLTIARSTLTEPSDELWRKAGDALIYSPAGVGTYRCTSDRIDVALAGGGNPQLATELLVANALPAVLWQRGRFVLHAAGVVLPGMTAAIALAGLSGSGKSSLARSLVARGARLLGDDGVALEGTVASGLPGGTFEEIDANGERDFRAVPTERWARIAALAAIVVLGPRGAPSGLTPAEPMRAVELLLAQRHRPGIATLLGRRREALAQAVALAKAVPVLTWSRHDGSPDLHSGDFDALASLVP
jgi:hypothetical protein